MTIWLNESRLMFTKRNIFQRDKETLSSSFLEVPCNLPNKIIFVLSTLYGDKYV